MKQQTLLPRFVFCLFLLQPLLDVLSFWYSGSVLTLALRLGLLGVTVLTGFCLSKHKRIYWLAAGLCLLLGLGHLWAIRSYGIRDLASDLTNFIRILQLPWTTLALITFLQTQERCYDSMKRGMAASLGVSLLIILLAVCTGTDPHTYEEGTGTLGWFQNTNSQSAILCMTVPVALVWLRQRWGLRSPLFWLGLAGGFGALYLIGTRLAFFGMLATAVGLSISALLEKQTRMGLALLGTALVFLLLTPWSPMVQHQKLYYAVQQDRQAQIDSSLSAYDLPALDEPGLTEEELAARQALWVEALTPVYTLYAPDFVEYFGAERTIALCGYSTVIGEITEQRPKKLMFAQLLMEDSPASARLFGLELSRFTVGEQNYDVENDFHGIYYLCGAAGLVLLLVFLSYFLFPVFRGFLTDFRAWCTPDITAWCIALGCCLLHACFTAGVLRRPNASFYLAACLSAVFFGTKADKRAHRKIERYK